MSENSRGHRSLRSALLLTLVLSLLLSMVTIPAVSLAGVSIPMKLETYNMEIPTGSYVVGTSVRQSGHIRVNYGEIYKVTAQIINRKTGKVAYTFTWRPNLQDVSLSKSLGNRFKINKLAAGSYRYKIIAYAQFGTKKIHKTVVSEAFSIVKKVPVISINGGSYPKHLEPGKKGRFAGLVSTSIGKITYISAKLTDEDGDVIMSTSIKPNKKSIEIRYTDINKKMPMSILPEGIYYYTLYAKAVGNGKTVTRTIYDEVKIEVAR